jgi:hypothetical protein
MNMIKKFFSSVTNVLLFLLGLAGLVIYMLSGKNDLLKSLLRIKDTSNKDALLNEKQKQVSEDLKNELGNADKIKDAHKSAKSKAESDNPEDFWKKH